MYVSTSELPNFFLFWWPRHLSCVYAWQYLVSCYGIYYLVILFIINSKETFCRQQHSGPVVGIIECPKLQAIKVAIRALDDLPCVTIPSNARDNNYQVWNGQRPLHFLPFVFPLVLLTLLVQALGWQATAGRTSMQRCAASTQWFNERISLAKYAHVRFSTSKYFS